MKEEDREKEVRIKNKKKKATLRMKMKIKLRETEKTSVVRVGDEERNVCVDQTGRERRGFPVFPILPNSHSKF